MDVASVQSIALFGRFGNGIESHASSTCDAFALGAFDNGFEGGYFFEEDVFASALFGAFGTVELTSFESFLGPVVVVFEIVFVFGVYFMKR